MNVMVGIKKIINVKILQCALFLRASTSCRLLLLGDRPTPQRSGLRERRTVDAMNRRTEQIVTELWVAEEELTLSEILRFVDRLLQVSLH